MSAVRPGMNSDKLHYGSAPSAEPGTSRVKTLWQHLLSVKCYFMCNDQHRTSRGFISFLVHNMVSHCQKARPGGPQGKRGVICHQCYCSQINFVIFIGIIYKAPVFSHKITIFHHIYHQKTHNWIKSFKQKFGWIKIQVLSHDACAFKMRLQHRFTVTQGILYNHVAQLLRGSMLNIYRFFLLSNVHQFFIIKSKAEVET